MIRRGTLDLYNNLYAVLGGTHLKFSGPGQVERSIEVLKSYDIDLIGASHLGIPESFSPG